jgi:hypothetical protein
VEDEELSAMGEVIASNIALDHAKLSEVVCDVAWDSEKQRLTHLLRIPLG